MKEITVKDKKGRILLQTKNGRCIVARFIDMDNETKRNIIELYVDLTGKDKREIESFLSYKSVVQEFCS